MKKGRKILLAAMSCLLLLLALPACAGRHTKADFSVAGTLPYTTELPDPAPRDVYQGEWIDKTKVPPYEGGDVINPIVITEIYSNCFFAQTVYPQPYSIKINGTLSEEWCVGDQVVCEYENPYYDIETDRFEADLVSLQESNVELDPDVCYKPVIYLYPEEETQVSVRLNLNGALTCTYPAYQDGWRVTAEPDGTLSDGVLTYNYLFWEARLSATYDFSEGFCVKGSETGAFLEQALMQLGLTRREANEMIVFWLQQMQDNPYNVIAFQTEAYTDAAGLEIDPAPDTLIRVFMAWYPSQSYVELPAQHLTAPERTGFTVVEWGGTRTK